MEKDNWLDNWLIALVLSGFATVLGCVILTMMYIWVHL